MSDLGALAGILATAYGAATTDDPQTALLWFNLSVASLAFAGIANALWLVRCHSATSTRRADVLDDVAETVRVPDAAAELTREGYVVVPGVLRYHVPDCAFVAGRQAQPATVRDLDRTRHVPCEVCVR